MTQPDANVLDIINEADISWSELNELAEKLQSSGLDDQLTKHLNRVTGVLLEKMEELLDAINIMEAS